MVAAVNLSAEYWNLVRITIALLQPLLVLALIGGLVVATAHLLTMIGTRWGDRRASSKAMFFSIVVHLLLIMGLVALIPEYRSNLISKLADLDSEPIRISMLRSPSNEVADDPSEKGNGGATAMFQAMSRPLETVIEPERTRTEVPSQAVSEMQPLPKPADMLPPEIKPSPDRESLPEPPPPSPMPEKPLAAMELEQAQADVKTESLPTQSRTEPATPEIVRERSTAPNSMAPSEQPVAPIRPNGASVDLSNSSYSPDRIPPDQADLARPQMELSRMNQDPVPLPAAPGPSLADSEPTVVPRSRPAESPDSAPGTLMTRTESRTSIPSIDDPGSSRPTRPSVSPELPSTEKGNRPEMSSTTLPVPQETPQLSRTMNPLGRPGGEERIPSAYQLRTEEEREKAILRFGGSQASEAAVDRSLKWMASVQNPAGYWDASEYGAGQVAVDENGINRRNAGREADVGVTALAVLAFLGKLNTVDQGEYAPQVNKALRWLVSQQTTKQWGEGWGSTAGYLGGNATEFESMYCHAMATFALGEAYAMSRDNPEAQWLRPPLEQAVFFILDVQNMDGGWRYIKGQREGDMSIFGWQVMALKSAEAAGLAIDPQRRLRMQKFLRDRQLGRAGGLAGYRLNEAASAPMTAEALYCRQMLGIASDSRATQEAIQMMMAHLPRRTTLNFYYWYYGTLALHHHGGPQWETWNTAVRELLISEQRTTGPLAGSWDPRDIWGGYGGRIYSTAIATLSLEVYYRYLPLYRLQDTQQ